MLVDHELGAERKKLLQQMKLRIQYIYSKNTQLGAKLNIETNHEFCQVTDQIIDGEGCDRRYRLPFGFGAL